jgi:hypothetical protein
VRSNFTFSYSSFAENKVDLKYKQLGTVLMFFLYSAEKSASTFSYDWPMIEPVKPSYRPHSIRYGIFLLMVASPPAMSCLVSTSYTEHLPLNSFSVSLNEKKKYTCRSGLIAW